MRHRFLPSIASLVVVILSGCESAKEIPIANQEATKVVKPDVTHNEQTGSAEHGHHGHRFTAPEPLARKWNTPERDRTQHPEQIVSALALKPGAEVADLGAGTGYLVAHLSKAVGKSGTVVAIDLEQAMIDYLAKHIEDLRPAHIVLQKVDADDPKLNPESMDGVVTLDTWHHITNREAYAKKVRAALKPGGRFVVVDFELEAESGPPKEMRIEPNRVMKELESAGFRVEIAKESMPMQYMVIGHKN